MGKKTISELSEDLQTFNTRIDDIETNTRKEQIQAIASNVFSAKMKEEGFQNKVRALFSDSMKHEEFLNKVGTLALNKAKEYVNGKIMWNVIIYILLGAGGLVAQRLLHLIP